VASPDLGPGRRLSGDCPDCGDTDLPLLRNRLAEHPPLRVAGLTEVNGVRHPRYVRDKGAVCPGTGAKPERAESKAEAA
jgi:hypothetical protein